MWTEGARREPLSFLRLSVSPLGGHVAGTQSYRWYFVLAERLLVSTLKMEEGRFSETSLNFFISCRLLVSLIPQP
jgi:hypothetical protein